MKVLVVLHEAILGGASLSVVRLLPLLEERGWRFAFWVPKGEEGEAGRTLAEQGYPVGGRPRPIFTSLRGLRLEPGPSARLGALAPYGAAFRRFVSDLDPALIHFNSVTTLIEALALGRRRRPSIVHVHEMLPGGRKGRATARLAGSLFDEVVAVSQASAARFGGPVRPRIVYESAPIPGAARPEPPPPLRVGSVGVISQRKGSDIYVEAARRVRERRPEIGFELVGAATDPLDAGFAQRVIAAAADAGVDYRPRADVGERMAAWHVFALPSRRDPFPIAMLEAMGLGLACVGARVDGPAEQLAGDVGLLVPGEDPAALAEAILQLDADDGLRHSLGAAARARTLERHAPEQQAAGLDAAWRAALARRR